MPHGHDDTSNFLSYVCQEETVVLDRAEAPCALLGQCEASASALSDSIFCPGGEVCPLTGRSLCPHQIPGQNSFQNCGGSSLWYMPRAPCLTVAVIYSLYLKLNFIIVPEFSK